MVCESYLCQNPLGLVNELAGQGIGTASCLVWEQQALLIPSCFYPLNFRIGVCMWDSPR